MGALYGPLHGGANEAVLRMLERIGSVDNIDKFLEGVKARKEKMFGFGHRRVPHAHLPEACAGVTSNITTGSMSLHPCLCCWKGGGAQ